VKVSVVTGICVDRDAISAAAIDQARAIASLEGVDDVVLIAQYHGRSCSLATLTITDSWSLTRSPAVQDSDVVIFHWGIRYDLFNALPLVAPGRRTIVQFHNITPPHLVAEAHRGVIEDSIRQIQLPAITGTELWADSEYNRETLHGWGYPADGIRVIPIAVDLPPYRRRRRAADDPVRLLTVGRLVPAKGVDVLVEAMDAVVQRLEGRVSLILAGNTEFSNRDFIDSLRESIRARRLGRFIKIKEDLDDRSLQKEYGRADVLVSPSLHEGLCVPVIEAYAAGCRVVGSDAGNLPNVVQPPDPIVPAGDPVGLAAAIVQVGNEVIAGVSALPPGVPDLIRAHSWQSVRDELALALLPPAIIRV
jgi:glycosyltransferase involved in cell wall biosynthesis